jgi:SAM-dependent methyltransferase
MSSDLLKLLVDSALEFTYQNNQFVHLNQKEQKVFEKIYRNYIRKIRTVVAASDSVDTLEVQLNAVIEHHFHDLSTNISRFFDAEAAQRVQENVILKKAVCSEYSPELQLDILGLQLEQMAQPVLDLGCGKTGRLVKYLNQHGVRAVGVDRMVDAEASLFEKDWFDLELIPDSWGTILSHMAFSNHFNFHHRYKNGQPEKYARLYVKILCALKPGGSFIYTPGLPYIEQFLSPDHYAVTRVDAVRFRIHLSESVQETGYVTKVTKR